MKSKKFLSLLVSLSILGTSFLSFTPNVQAATIKNTTKNNVTIKSVDSKNFSVSIQPTYGGDIHVSITSLDGSFHNYEVKTYFEDEYGNIIGQNLTVGSGISLYKTIHYKMYVSYWKSAMVFTTVDGEIVDLRPVTNLG